MGFTTDFLTVRYPTRDAICMRPITAEITFKVMQRPFFTSEATVKIVLKADPIGHKGRTSQQDVIYINVNTPKDVFYTVLKRFIATRFQTDEKQVECSWKTYPRKIKFRDD